MHSMKKHRSINKCPITKSKNKHVYLDLGLMPLVNNLNNTKEESLNCPKYPLAIQLFEDSGLSTLTVEIDPKILYSHYLYKYSLYILPLSGFCFLVLLLL